MKIVMFRTTIMNMMMMLMMMMRRHRKEVATYRQLGQDQGFE